MFSPCRQKCSSDGILVILFVNYAFAIGCVLLIGDSAVFLDTEEDIAAQQALAYFGGLDKTLFTLVDLLMGNFGGVARPVLKFLPWTWVIFVAYTAIGVLLLLNLVTATIVEHALSVTAESNEELVRRQAAVAGNTS